MDAVLATLLRVNESKQTGCQTPAKEPVFLLRVLVDA
jgi:hypothetical protein